MYKTIIWLLGLVSYKVIYYEKNVLFQLSAFRLMQFRSNLPEVIGKCFAESLIEDF